MPQPAKLSIAITLLLIYSAIKWVIKIYRWLRTLKAEGTQLDGKVLAAMNQLTWHMSRAANLSTEVGCTPGGVADPNFDENEPLTFRGKTISPKTGE